MKHIMVKFKDGDTEEISGFGLKENFQGNFAIFENEHSNRLIVSMDSIKVIITDIEIVEGSEDEG